MVDDQSGWAWKGLSQLYRTDDGGSDCGPGIERLESDQDAAREHDRASRHDRADDGEGLE